MTSHEFVTYLYQAMATKYGITIRTDNLTILRARLYKARAETKDPDLKVLQLRPDPKNPTTILWILKGEASDNG